MTEKGKAGRKKLKVEESDSLKFPVILYKLVNNDYFPKIDFSPYIQWAFKDNYSFWFNQKQGDEFTSLLNKHNILHPSNTLSFLRQLNNYGFVMNEMLRKDGSVHKKSDNWKLYHHENQLFHRSISRTDLTLIPRKSESKTPKRDENIWNAIHHLQDQMDMVQENINKMIQMLEVPPPRNEGS